MRNGKILNVRIELKTDDCPDLSLIGTYSNQPGDKDKTIDRKERGDQNRNEFQYFIATMSGDDTGNPDSVAQDYARMEAYSNGEWCMIGIIAKAEVQTARNSTIQTIRSGGLWGIESDSDDDYFKEVADEQLSELRMELEAIGFSTAQIDRAFAKAEY